jgi:hypothetical protein
MLTNFDFHQYSIFNWTRQARAAKLANGILPVATPRGRMRIS